MKFMKTAAIVTLLAGCASASFGVTNANAITLMEWLNRKKQPVAEAVQPLPGVGTSLQQPAEKQASRPTPKVSSPRYYTYKADPVRRIQTAAKATDPVVTGSVQNSDLPPMLRAPLTDVRQYLADVSALAPGEVAKAVEGYYGANGKFIWIEGTSINAQAKSVVAVLADAASVGLDPRDYAVEMPTDDFDRNDIAAREKTLVDFEVRLTSAALTYIQDTVRGRIDPNKISGYHDFKRKSVNLSGKLKVIASSHDAAAFLKSQNPSSPEFLALVKELATLKAQNDDAPRIEIAPGTLLKPGIANPELANVIAGIRQKGSDALKAEHAATLAAYQGTPDYTPELVSLVEGFQKENGLKADGIVGKASIRLLVGDDSTADRIHKLEVAMEQARWLPADLGSRYVFINQPAFMVYYHDQNKEQFSMRVVVGSKSNQTYFFEDEIQTVEFNPYWGVPQSIIINEMLPKLRSDPGYLDRLGYQVEVGGRPVSSYDVNWGGSTSGIAVRQPPSSDNALGELKILFPNSHAIYMHDTPSKSFFARDQRALSHGCVRLADPRRMAAAVLNTSVDDIAKQISGGRNKGVQVPQRIPVYVAYFTAWPNKDGKVEYFDDVYERDMYMDRAFEATRTARQAEG
ncbi:MULTISPECIES: murein L,D-transpeptidase [unclassified Rhizobium]|uniref:L,D-transpeptidase family protein n=1 Tax=unclassified Rhizobium TaxID=2613769 RepID=UPI0006F6587D|nr:MULTISPECIES: murein L,D-transpeptidase [unclassified Rhizobium]KQV34748.1 peptidoglycan-binding protein [Rhizobium sp. Root1212]KRD24082.1 peptidoglycan-binding protein [Rhizobium sp. Root268]